LVCARSAVVLGGAIERGPDLLTVPLRATLAAPRVASFREAVEGLAAVLEGFVEGLEIQPFHVRGHGIGDGFTQGIGLEQAGHGGEETDHDDIQHLAAKFVGQARGRHADTALAVGQLFISE